MTTKLVTAGAILVVAIVFGFIFWNQFSSNQQNLAGGDANTSQTTTKTTTSTSKSEIPKNDNVSAIETELSTFNANEIDSDSAQMNSQLNGF